MRSVAGALRRRGVLGVLIAGSLSVGWSVEVLAAPEIARMSSAPVVRAGDLLEHARGGAEQLRTLPPLWDWASPSVQPRLVQAAPAPVAPVQAAADAAADAEDGGILDEVSVTATRRPTRQRDATQTVNVIKREDFQAQGAVTVSDALLLVPGFNNSTPALGGQSNISANFLRGFDDRRYIILRDGLFIGSPQTGRSDPSGIPLDDLERIEVITGGSTLRYGSGSVGGVINLITQVPKGPPKLTLSYELGSYSFNQYKSRYSGGDDTFSYSVGFTGIAAGNDYPFGFTLPTTPVFYGRNDVVANGGFTDSLCSIDGQSLFGCLSPEIGPPLKVQGINKLSFVGNDYYTAKFTYKPSAFHRLTFRGSQRESSIGDRSPGYYDFNACFGGPNFRILPIDQQTGAELPCNIQTFQPVTPSTLFGNTFDTDAFGRPLRRVGIAYGDSEQASGDDSFFRRRKIGETELSLRWDYDITSTTTLNSYIAYYRNFNGFSTPTPYFFNTNVAGGTLVEGVGAFIDPGAAARRRVFTAGERFEAQTALSTPLSPGQIATLGINYTADNIEALDGSTTGTGFNPPVSVAGRVTKRGQGRFSVFLVDDINFSEEVKANVGLRYTNISGFGSVLTPGVGLRVTPTSWLSLRGNWSEVFNAPNLTNLFLGGALGQGNSVGNPRLTPERGTTFDVGLDITPARNLSVRATYFASYIDNTILTQQFVNPDFRPGAGIPRFINQPVNFRSRRGVGIEFTTDWQISDQWRARVVWTNVDARPYGGPPETVDDINFPNFLEVQDYNVPFNSLITAVTYANRGYTFTLLGRYDSGKYRFRGTPISSQQVPSWFTLDLNGEIPITPFATLTFNVLNLLDTQYEYLDANPAPGLTFRVGTRFELGG